ncbi:MAG: AAA family ATPase [Deltaproteobacteria bacterium]|jgi:superfamily I DNA/RNA helicase|nr:AAA family ATPase [Deltaproteobacteria bacterium]
MPPPNAKPKLTDEQQAVAESTRPFMAITAYAGAGKTSTLKAFAARRPKSRLLYLAFNRAMAEEAKTAFGALSNVEVKTLHGLAWSHVGFKYRNLLGNFRPLDLKKYVSGAKGSSDFGPAKILFDLINSWTLADSPTISDFWKAHKKKIGPLLEENKVSSRVILNALKALWKDMLSGLFTMTHNGYFKLFQLSKPKLDYFSHVLVDEAQDLNDAMIDAIFGATGDKILVGDPFQQIYGWNGAVNALGKAEKMGATPFYLTRSFRCTSAVAGLANAYLNLLGAKKPFRGREAQLATPASDDKAALAIIARTNAAIFNYAAEESSRKRIHYNGGFDGYQFEILKDINHLRAGRVSSIADPFVKRFASLANLTKYATETQDIPTLVRIEVEKKYQSEVHSLFERLKARQTIDPRDADVLISTAHKVKGNEFPRVTLLSDFLFLENALKLGRRTSAKPGEYPPEVVSREEFQLLYVSITRSYGAVSLPQEYVLRENDVKEFRSLVGAGKIIFI